MKRHLPSWLTTSLLAGCTVVAFCAPPTGNTAVGRTYYVDGSHPKAADTNPGTAEAPWKTIGRAGKATELTPGGHGADPVQPVPEWAQITVSGETGCRITIASRVQTVKRESGADGGRQPADWEARLVIMDDPQRGRIRGCRGETLTMETADLPRQRHEVLTRGEGRPE